MNMATRKSKPAKGWKRFGHRSHVSATRMRLDDECLKADARRLERRYTKPGRRKEEK